MKVSTLQSVKFQKLRRRLGLTHWQAIGLLESIWLVTQTNAPCGDIGRLSNEEIASLIEWDGDPDELIGHLIECRWIDTCSECRLLIHDWHDHVPTYVKGNLAKHGKEIRRPKEAAKQPAKEAAKQPAKEAAKQPAKEAPPILSYPIVSNPIVSIIDSGVPESPKQPTVESIYQSFVDLFATKRLTVPRKLTPERRKKIQSRLRNPEWIQWMRDAVKKLPLKGEWQPDIDWFIRSDDNALKVAEGKYDNWKTNGKVINPRDRIVQESDLRPSQRMHENPYDVELE